MALGVAERADVIVDFTGRAGKTLYLENRLEQTNGRGPTDSLNSAGQGNLLLKIVVDLPAVADNSRNLAVSPLPTYYALPSTTATPRVRRSFNFDQTRNGEWTINDEFFGCDQVRFRVKQNSVELWDLRQNRSDWQHPIHIHFEEFQILSGAPGLYPLAEQRRRLGRRRRRLGRRRLGRRGERHAGRGQPGPQGRRPAHQRHPAERVLPLPRLRRAAIRCTATTWSTRTTP